MDVDGSPVEYCLTSDMVAGRLGHFALGREASLVVSVQTKSVTIDMTYVRISSIAQPGSALRDRLQNRLNISRRTGDHAQNFTGRRLLFQRLGEIVVTLLQFLKQPDVLDGDHRLVGKRFKQFDLPLG